MVKWNSFVEWLFLGLLTYFAWQINSNMSDLQKAVTQLNSQVVVMISDNSVAKETIKDHEVRIREIEHKLK